MLATAPLNAGRKRVFGSVFSPASLEARPPYASTFETPFTSFQSTASSSTIKTGSQAASFVTAPQEPPDREAWDHAWYAATAFLSVPDLGFAPIYAARETDGSEALKQWNRLSPPSKETGEALTYLTAVARHSSTKKDLFGWYADEIRRHFLTNLRGGLHEVCSRCIISGQASANYVYSFWRSPRKTAYYGQSSAVCNWLVASTWHLSCIIYCRYFRLPSRGAC